MQPYFFPYIGYFKLINAVDKFIIYDDVNYIKRGWINRNNILINGKSNLINLPVKKVSQNKLISESFLELNNKTIIKFSNSVQMAYKKAPFFKKVNPLYSIPCNHAYFEPKLMSRKELEDSFMNLSERLSSFKNVFKRAFYNFNILSFILLKMNLEFRKDHQRMEVLYNSQRVCI